MLYTSSYFYNSIFGLDTEARNQAREARSEAGDLRGRFDRLSLMTMALWTLARDKLGITDEEFLARVQELDMTDGRMDGKMTQGVCECPNCKRPLSPRHPKCIYCGNARSSIAPP